MNDELMRLWQWRSDVPPPSTAAEQTARAALGRVMAAEGALRARPGRPRRPRFTRRRLGLAAALAAGLLLGVLLPMLGHGTSGPSSAVAAVLERLARAASAQPPLGPLTAGHYLYVDSVQFNESDTPEVGCTMLMPDRRRIWIGADGSGRLLESFGQPSYPSAGDRERCARAHVPSGAGTFDTWFAPRCLSDGPRDLTRLPTDPAQLARQLRARKIEGGPPGPAEDFVQIGDLLRETAAPPALRAALYRVAATIPGVRVLGRVRDARGRAGLGLVDARGDVRQELIVDPGTGVLLAERTTAPGAPAQWALYRTSLIVSRIPGRAPRPLRPACVNFGGREITTSPGVGVEIGGGR